MMMFSLMMMTGQRMKRVSMEAKLTTFPLFTFDQNPQK